MTSWLERTIPEIAGAVASGDVSAEEIAKESIDAIERSNAELGAFLAISGEQALEQAREVDRQRARGDKLGKLAGVPIALKDALCTRGIATTCASKILTRNGRAFRPPYDATVVARLKAEGAVLPGKCNMDEFAMGSSSENSAFYPVKNPWDLTRAPGGSSGGSAVAVAARMTPRPLRSHTRGSIPQPAPLTGLVRGEPADRRGSPHRVHPFAPSPHQARPLAHHR